LDAEQTLALVRRLNSFPVTLESGRRYTLVLPSLERQIVSGVVSLPIMREAAKAEANGDEQAKADENLRAAMKVMLDTYDQWLADAIIGIEDDEVEMTVEAVRLIPEDDREELLEYLKREKDPKAVTPA
jgi:hypothetical protein